MCLWILICLCKYHIDITAWTWNRTLGIQGEGRILTKPLWYWNLKDHLEVKGLEEKPKVVQVWLVRATADPPTGSGRAEKGHHWRGWRNRRMSGSRAHWNTCIFERGKRWRLVG